MSEHETSSEPNSPKNETSSNRTSASNPTSSNRTRSEASASGSPSARPTIKIAPSSGHKSREGADPGPGDLNAAPSEAPQLVEISPPPKSEGASGAVERTATTAERTSGTAERTTGIIEQPDGKKKKKAAKFRYHKRVSVSTHGRTDPSAIMEKVNEKDHKAGITVDKLDPQELMRRAGIEGKEGSHWRIRLRQTRRTTKNGKTVTETRVAYRDSEGKMSVKTIEGEMCKRCSKKMEECDCP